MRKAIIIAVVASLLQPVAESGANPQIFVLLEASTDCQGRVTLPPATLVRGSIKASPNIGGGIQSARFRIDGLPASQVTVLWSFGPEAVGGTGDPFGNGGSVLFASCQTTVPITLYDITLFSPAGFNGVLTFGPDLSTSDTCPTVEACDTTLLCASTYTASRLSVFRTFPPGFLRSFPPGVPLA